MSEPIELSVTRFIAAPPDKVWQVTTDRQEEMGFTEGGQACADQLADRTKPAYRRHREGNEADDDQGAHRSAKPHYGFESECAQ